MRSPSQADAARRLSAAIDTHAAALRSDPLYLDRCQVDTPEHLVELVWQLVRARRPTVSKVVDFGAGEIDGSFRHDECDPSGR